LQARNVSLTSLRSRVQNLFHSVQLNVNNPHFLIMQGRITKVLNMKPPEILSMLEEVCRAPARRPPPAGSRASCRLQARACMRRRRRMR